MIDYISGRLAELTPAQAVVEAHGVGWLLNISLNTYTALQGQSGEVRLYVHEALVTGGRDDSFTLYGFATRQERQLYRMLITVKGVGGGVARMMLSAMSPRELCDAIAGGNERVLKGVKGIGLKTAQLIIVELRDRIVESGIATELHAGGAAGAAPVDGGVRDEAVSALVMLGFSPAPSAKVVSSILTEQPGMAVEEVIKAALKLIKS